ncbi:Iron-sulfur cluster repair protein YtfE [Tepidimonas fonticaldi]|uniref:Iron-sulfur cluster repair protein YtfE n=2 Tax=Tepidimonas fonticaldi TaxID=1101373 RepID=A0A554XM03_9BURK|nr:Iron-sulfur cluster repair protein YtfE [Tepidimonas fonticaldi]
MTTTMPLDLDHCTVGEIAARLPGATDILRRYRIDFCCGGQRSLREACAQRDTDPARVIEELQRLATGMHTAVAPAEPTDLIEHILQRYHEVHRQQLPELIRLANKVEAVHAGHALVPAGLAQHLQTMQAELLAHMEKEEQVLFPLLAAGGSPMARFPIGVMRQEHDMHAAQLRRLHELTHDLTLPEDACHTWRALYRTLQQFVDDLMQHIHLENNVLFPRFEAA